MSPRSRGWSLSITAPRMTLSDGPYPAGRNHAEAGWIVAFDNLAAFVAG
jgi:hypothetical protein